MRLEGRGNFKYEVQGWKLEGRVNGKLEGIIKYELLIIERLEVLAAVGYWL